MVRIWVAGMSSVSWNYMLYMYKVRPPKLFYRQISIHSEKTSLLVLFSLKYNGRLWKKYMRLVLKTCEQIFGLRNFSRHEMFLVSSRNRKSLVMSTQKPDLLMCLYDLDVPGIRMNTLLNLFMVNFSIFSLFRFL